MGIIKRLKRTFSRKGRKERKEKKEMLRKAKSEEILRQELENKSDTIKSTTSMKSFIKRKLSFNRKKDEVVMSPSAGDDLNSTNESLLSPGRLHIIPTPAANPVTEPIRADSRQEVTAEVERTAGIEKEEDKKIQSGDGEKNEEVEDEGIVATESSQGSHGDFEVIDPSVIQELIEQEQRAAAEIKECAPPLAKPEDIQQEVEEVENEETEKCTEDKKSSGSAEGDIPTETKSIEAAIDATTTSQQEVEQSELTKEVITSEETSVTTTIEKTVIPNGSSVTTTTRNNISNGNGHGIGWANSNGNSVKKSVPTLSSVRQGPTRSSPDQGLLSQYMAYIVIGILAIAFYSIMNYGTVNTVVEAER